MRKRHQICILSIFMLVCSFPSIANSQEPSKLKNVRTVLGTTYCVDQDFLPTLNQKILEIRKLVRDARAQGKITGYISIPLSAAGGGSSEINKAVSQHVKERVEKLYGDKVWMLAPGSQEATIPKVGNRSARGQEYMYMWTEVLAGEDGLGQDFDLFYFVGRADFWNKLGITSENSIARLAEEADKLGLAGDSKKNFISYYTLRASALSSKGAHDEWNLLRLINEARLADPKYGIAAQIASFYEGHPVELDDAESAVTPGYEGSCNP